MFYFLEIFYRFIYILLSFAVTFFIIFSNRYNSSFLLLYYNTIDFDESKFLSYSVDKTFIFRSPFELLDFDFKYSFLITFILIIPSILWNFYYFCGTYFKRINILLIKFTLFFYLSNYFFFKRIFAFMWNILEYLIISDLNVYFLNIDYDLNLYNFISNLTELYVLFNLFILLLFLVILNFCNLSLKYFIHKKLMFIRFLTLFLLVTLFVDIYILFFCFFFSFFLFFFSFYFSVSFFIFKNIHFVNIKKENCYFIN